MLKDLVIDFSADSIDFYKNMMDPKVFPLLMDGMYREMLAKLTGTNS